jgi:catechol 2,3-dioxygenase-like lactoylglutathione lyase family enzyme
LEIAADAGPWRSRCNLGDGLVIAMLDCCFKCGTIASFSKMEQVMRRVTGLGGVFFKCDDPKAQQAWYEKHLGLPVADDGCAIFQWRQRDAEKPGTTIWGPFPKTTEYFGPGPATFMINYRVENLDAILKALESEGIWIDPKREDSQYGRFAWIKDPEGNRIELWEPPEGS